MPNKMLLSMRELEAGLDPIRQSPKDAGVVELIVRRPRAARASWPRMPNWTGCRGSWATIGSLAARVSRPTARRIPTRN